MKKVYWGVGIILLLLVGYTVLTTQVVIQEPMQDFGGERIGQKTIFNNGSALGVGTATDVGENSNCVITVAANMFSTTSDSITFKFMGSSYDPDPNFTDTVTTTELPVGATTTATSTVLNNVYWDYIEVVDLEDLSSIDGDTGDTIVPPVSWNNYTTGDTSAVGAIASSSRGVQRYRIEDTNVKWVNMEITTYTNASYTDGTSTLNSFVSCKGN